MLANVWKERPPRDFQVWCPQEFDLTAPGPVVVPIYAVSPLPPVYLWGSHEHDVYTDSTVDGDIPKLVVKELIVMFIEGATHEDVSMIRLGNNSNNYQHTTFDVLGNEMAGDVVIKDQADFDGEPRVFSGNWLQVMCMGNSVGTGKVRVGVTLSQDYSQWHGYKARKS